jgi:3-deoxy-D-manno-octulosonate 8-phosphate phosphatase (KDO 8-P phosphatase)
MSDLESKARAIRLLVLDVDGVLTDGRLYFSQRGEDLKCFDVRDGYGLKSVQRAGITIAIISGRSSGAVETRARELGIEHVHQGIDDKLSVLLDLRKRLGIESGAVACIGDDAPDVPVLKAAGLAVAVADAHECARAVADYVTRRKGGRGAVREVCDLLVAAQGGDR